jgi:hypothetical protein
MGCGFDPALVGAPKMLLWKIRVLGMIVFSDTMHGCIDKNVDKRINPDT